ncbi:MAG: hypothetical protein AAFX55_18225 [Bacteroidota bacterium]
MKNFLFLLLTFLVLHGNAQVNFQQGYIIDNTGKKVQCYIKNKDWKKNPTSITYKTNKSSQEETLTINELKEFRIADTDHFYQRYTINKELMGSLFDNLQSSKGFVLLKVLIDGQSKLFEFHTEGKYYFFYAKDDKLVFLNYEKTVDENNKVIENAKFKKQLFDHFKCDNLTLVDYSNLRYNSTSLSEFFSKYNHCKGAAYYNYYDDRTKSIFNFKLRGGFNVNTDFSNEPAYYAQPPDGDRFNDIRIDNFDTKSNVSLGIELEWLLPFDHNKWGIFIAPNYQSISGLEGSKTYVIPFFGTFVAESEISLSILELPIGFRRYFIFNSSTKAFLHIAYIHNINLNSDHRTTFDTSFSRDLTASDNNKSNGGVFLGVGLDFLEKYAIELNYYFASNVNLDGENQVNRRGFSINASYTIF